MKTRISKNLRFLSILCLAALMVTGTITRAQYTYTTLDDLLAGLSASTFAFGISGSNIVGYYNDTDGARGFVYDGSTWTTLDDPLVLKATPQGIDVTKIV